MIFFFFFSLALAFYLKTVKLEGGILMTEYGPILGLGCVFLSTFLLKIGCNSFYSSNYESVISLFLLFVGYLIMLSFLKSYTTVRFLAIDVIFILQFLIQRTYISIILSKSPSNCPLNILKSIFLKEINYLFSDFCCICKNK